MHYGSLKTQSEVRGSNENK